MKIDPLALAELPNVAWGSHPWLTLTGYLHAVSAYWRLMLAGVVVVFIDVLKFRGRESKVPFG